ncbi:MAG TPA: hypothetical protein VE964_13865 [Myxococcales bacterium]|nr:hypothetical protein [Myxococcales bacterium]
MSCSKDYWVLRTLQLACLAAALAAAGCKGPDPSGFSCSSSQECPSDYHCDLAGSLKCVSGAPVPKTITADASKFLLVRQPGTDGTVRSTISASPGALTSSPDFVGVRVIASKASQDVASAPVQSNGSVPVFQLPQADTQVSLRAQDDSGHQVPITGYHERVVVSFTGKDVAGNTNPIAAYDAATGTNALFDPAVWTAGLTEIPASSPLVNGFVTPAAYNGLAAIDGISVATAFAPQPTANGPIGWERISFAPNATDPTFSGPSPRTDMAVGQISIGAPSGFYQFVAYGGLDSTGAVADPGSTPTIWAFNPNQNPIGWTTVPTVTSNTTSPFPSNFASNGLPITSPNISRAGVALGFGNSFNCTTGACSGTNYNFSFFVAGGLKPDGTKTNNVFAYGTKTQGSNIFLGWWDATAEGTNLGASNPRLLAANSRMATAQLFNIPVPSGTNQIFYSGIVMVGGDGIIPAGQTGANNDTAACQYLTTFGGANPTFQVNSCTTPEWATAAAAGQIGFRTGQAFTATDNAGGDNAVVYMFGGSRSAGPAGTTALQNDLWKGTISVVCTVVTPPATPPCAAGAVAATQITWQLLPTAGTAPTTKPSARSGAVIAFNESHKLVLYGGTDGTGAQNDVWELDLSPGTTPPAPPLGGFVWRKLTLEPTAGAIGPPARTKTQMLGSLSYANASATMVFGGTVGTTPTNEVWALSRQGTPRLLIKAPTGISSRSTATNGTLSVTAVGTSIFFLNELYGWDGTVWQVLGQGSQSGNIFGAPGNALSYVQADGNMYLMVMSRVRSTVSSVPSNFSAQLDGLEAALDFQ